MKNKFFTHLNIRALKRTDGSLKMERNKICEGIREIINLTLKGEVDLSNISEDTDLDYEIGIDSIIGIEILVRAETYFGISIDDEDLELDLISTIATLADYVEKKLMD